MKVKEIRNLISCYQYYMLKGARTGKVLAKSWANKKEFIEKFDDKGVSDAPLYTELILDNNKKIAKPIIVIYVTGE